MKSVGQILLEERKKQGRSLVEIHKLSKIPIFALKRIEADDFSKLPPATFSKGFLKNYAEILGLDSGRILAVFRRDYIENIKGLIIPKEFSEEVGREGFGFNPKTFSFISLGVFIFLILVFLFFQLRTIFLPPKINLDELPAKVNEKELMIKGRVNREAVISVNGELVILEGKKFSKKVELRPGKNTIEVKAVDRRKKESEKIIIIELDSGAQ